MPNPELPHHAGIERLILGSILIQEGPLGSTLLSALVEICPAPLHRWFFERDHRMIALALDRCPQGSGTPSIESVSGILASIPLDQAVAILAGRTVRPRPADAGDAMVLSAIGGLTGLMALCEGSTTRHVATFADNCRLLHEYGIAREGIAILRDAATKLYRMDPHQGASSIFSETIQALGPASTAASSGRNAGGMAGLAVADGDSRQASSKTTGSATWGLPSLDTAVPLAPGTVTVLTAPPGRGKTTLAIQAADCTSTACDHPGSVCFASLEMTGQSIATILARRRLGISQDLIRSGRLTPEDRARLEVAIKEWDKSDSFFIRDVSQKFTPDMLVAWATQRQMLAQPHGISLLVIDYLQLLDARDPRQTEYQRVSDATRAIKALSLSLNIPILLLAQLNREGRKGSRDKTGAVTVNPEPRAEDLRGSGTIEQDADAIVALHCATTSPGFCVPLTAMVLKNRNGPSGQRLPILFHTGLGSMSEPADEPAHPNGNRMSRLDAPPSPDEDHFTHNNLEN